MVAGVRDDTGLIDYEKLAETARVFLPRLIICGYSAYPRDLYVCSCVRVCVCVCVCV